jgi:hypothetical protein
LKRKIPFLSRTAKKDEEDEVSEESSSQKDSTDIEEYDGIEQPKWKQALSKQLPFLAKILNKSPAQPPASSDKTDVGAKVPAAADQRQKIIRIVLVLGALYFVYDSFLNPAEETIETVEEAPANTPPKKNKKRPRPVDSTVGETPVEPVATPPVEPVETPPVEPVAPAPVEPVATAPVEPVAPAPVEPVATAPVEPVATPPAEPLPPVDSVDIPIETVGDDATISEDSAPIEATAPEEVVEKVPDLISPDLIPGSESTTGGESSAATDQVVEGQTPEDNPDMTEQILKDLEKQIQDKKQEMPAAGAPYIDPPEYENFGRGLVYNCRGKHWACVNGGSYQVCQQNYSSLKGAQKPKECYPDSVFQTEKACVWMQKERITSGTKTDFCQ